MEVNGKMIKSGKIFIVFFISLSVSYFGIICSVINITCICLEFIYNIDSRSQL